MISVENNLFILESENTSYLFCADNLGRLEHLHYGAKVGITKDTAKALSHKWSNQNGCTIVADSSAPNVTLDDMRMEISTRGKGEFKQPFIEIINADGSVTNDFRLVSHEIKAEKQYPQNLPSAYGEEGVSTLVLYLEDKNCNLGLQLVYTVFEKTNCITRFARLTNNSENEVKIKGFASAQLDLPMSQCKIVSFHGDWTREMDKHETLITGGSFCVSSQTGFSSSKANPFVIIAEDIAAESFGKCYATNLIYSGNHKQTIEVLSNLNTHVLTGINWDTLQWTLNVGESFDTPEAVFTYSACGYGGISKNMHGFVNEHIVRGEYKSKPRPILINSWEANYFSFTESGLCKLAKKAKDVGIELFVLDDGWFGKRNDDTTSLGDWQPNTAKLPNGLYGLSKKINNIGLDFGIWVEPEMVNVNSQLYKNHPEWAMDVPNRPHSEGRNQRILALSNPDVQTYLIESMTKVFHEGNVKYVKWDMNRNFSDVYDKSLPIERQGEVLHRYILGLYAVMAELVKRFPHVLFEACASGGNRFDLGMLCYMPQIWASDNTDAMCRFNIQTGYSYGYPQSTVSAHVSSCPNHQTLRVTPLETRYAIASTGVLGYECNLCDMSKDELSAIAQQIATYKKWRQVLQFGNIHRLENGFCIVSQDKQKAVCVIVQAMAKANSPNEILAVNGLDSNTNYHFYNVPQKHSVKIMGDLINTIAPIHVKQNSVLHSAIDKFIKLDSEEESYHINGALLANAGICLAQKYAGTGFEKNTRLYTDFASRIYYIEAE